MNKVCTSCFEEKEIGLHYYNASRYMCIDCEREAARERMASVQNKAGNAFRTAQKSAAKYGAYDNLSYDDVLYLFKLAGGICSYTNQPSECLSLEHVIPLSEGGTNTIDNILVIDLEVNRQKRITNMMDFIEERYNPHSVLPLVKLLATRGNMPYEQLYDRIFEYQKAESEAQYRRLVEATERKKKVTA
ncbi:HNH endonuclease [Solibacillus ferritrahens]|uniref:HNH endonuclease n=1 Tax=Solibacillus ferritrahens TaxID=3098620 RepID=UPI00300AD411